MNYKTDYTIDTHALIWYMEGHPALSLRAKRAMDEIFLGKKLGALSVISMLEAWHNKVKNPKFDFVKFRQGLATPNLVMIPVAEEIIKLCFDLPDILEIHDRVIAATTKLTESILITRDPILKKIEVFQTLW